MKHVGGYEGWRIYRYRDVDARNRASDADLTMQLPDDIAGATDEGCGKKSTSGEKTDLADAKKAKLIVSCCRTSAFKEKHTGDLATRVPLIVTRPA
jgi:hypothetical protein